jgi:hypothetical protein
MYGFEYSIASDEASLGKVEHPYTKWETKYIEILPNLKKNDSIFYSNISKN